MTPIVPRVAVFYPHPISLDYKTSDIESWHAKGFEICSFSHDILSNELVNGRYNLLVYIGVASRWLQSQNNTIPKLFVDTVDEITGDLLYQTYVTETLKDVNPVVSMFTPAYKTFSRFDRLYKSIRSQSFSNWEWIILDDSPGNDNYEYMVNAVGSDHRVKIYKANRNDGLVGSTKRQAASLCNGDYLMEVDHDDELHHLALELCVSAFEKYPDAGFCYSDSAELFEDGGPVRYGDNFGMGQGYHYTTYYQGRSLLGACVPLNASSIRHIVGVPNHFRCWRRNTYFELNRHNNKLAVVDDYELLLRTFLKTRMIHIGEVLYVQYMNTGGNNTQEPRRAEIQRLVQRIQQHYEEDIHKRILELGGEDWAYHNIHTPPPPHLFRSTLTYEYKI